MFTAPKVDPFSVVDINANWSALSSQIIPIFISVPLSPTKPMS